jgi:hypothetical protein
MMERWNTGILGLYCIALKNIMIHEINQSWIEKISIAVLKSSGFGKTRLPFMFWPEGQRLPCLWIRSCHRP